MKFFFLLTLFISCKFTHSPYQVGQQKLLQNETNLSTILRDQALTGPDFKIAFLSDTHNYYEDLRDLVKTVNNNGPYSFVIVTGDLTNHGLLEEYQKTKELLNDLNFPYLVVVGNHDLLSNGDKIFEKMYGKTDFNLTYKDIEFIIFNNNNWESGGVIPNTVFVAAALVASAAPFKILVSHVSLGDADRFSPAQVQSWENLVSVHGVDYVFNGHNHNPEETDFSSAKHITVGSPNKRVYFELIMNSGGLTHKKITF
ncbi:MAG TPA: metallophosphoesterase [Bacteriovoracaceae bacterium]|nr:metallophosphoesterase [Bacteriovoracaceae bacterium]